MHRFLASFLLLCCAACLPALSQTTPNPDFQRYIAKYKDIAVDQMHKHKIPASITLAQALLESGAGKGELAVKSNNHFGIKRGSSWQGPTVTHNDDRRGEHFRKYKTVEESYEDHSQFLLRERYQRLFRLNILDYKGWARGLKACGYATSPVYADRLINLIELYRLYELDEPIAADGQFVARTVVEEPEYEEVTFSYHNMLTNNNVLCIRAKEGDTWESLSKELRISKSKLLKLNEAVESVSLHDGDYVYLGKKATKGPKSMKGRWHKIRQGESMYSIAQLYGIRLASLYKLNFKDADYQPVANDLLRVR